MTRIWFVYKMDAMSLDGWKSFGIHHEKIIDNRDMTDMARALAVLSETAKDVDWYSGQHEYWLLECPCAPAFVCVRPGQNPYDSGYIVSPIPMPHLKVAALWEVSK